MPKTKQKAAWSFFHVTAVTWVVCLSLLPSPSRLLSLQDLSPPEGCSHSPVRFPAGWWWWWWRLAVVRWAGLVEGRQDSKAVTAPVLRVHSLASFWLSADFPVECLLSSHWSGADAAKIFFFLIQACLRSFDVYYLSRTAVTKLHKLSVSESQKFVVSQICWLKVPNQGVGRATLPQKSLGQRSPTSGT